jgi:predicted dehydrogenase
MSPLRVGIIGYGYTGQIHARAYLANAAVDLVAVADSENGLLANLPARVRTYARYEDLLDSSVDAVSICVPTHLHCKVVLDALTLRKHVLVEKPIAMNVEEAQSMLRAAKAAGRVLYVGMTHRFYPELLQAKKLIDEGVIGTLVACNDSVLEHLGFLNVRPWYLQRKFAGGGAMLTSGIHLVDRLRWFVGDEVNMVAASAGNPYFGADVEDAGQMFLRFRRGISAQITVAFMREPHPLVCDLQVIGTRGSITVHTWRGYEVYNESGRREKIIYTDEPHRIKVEVGIAGEISEFCSSIAEGRAPWPTAEESARALEVVMASYRAAETGAAITFGEPDAF